MIKQRATRNKIYGNAAALQQIAMTIGRVLLLAVLAALASTPVANAQFAGMPGMPPGTPGIFPGMGDPYIGVPPACQRIWALRDETVRDATAIRTITDSANAAHKPRDAAEICKLFKVYLASEGRFLRELGTNADRCGFPAQATKDAHEGYRKDTEAGAEICELARYAPIERFSAPFKWDGILPSRDR